jgi:hypothetical protein
MVRPDAELLIKAAMVVPDDKMPTFFSLLGDVQHPPRRARLDEEVLILFPHQHLVRYQ